MEEKRFYVYEWFIKNTGEVFYVGKGTGNRYKTLSSRNYFFKCMYDTHDCAVRKIYINLTEQEAFDKEIETIKYYRENTNYRLTNQTNGGEGTSGWKPSEEFRKKQSKIHIQQWQDPNFKAKMIKIRQDINGVYKSTEFRAKISKIVQGESNPNYQHYWSEKQKQDLSEKKKVDPYNKNEYNPKSKKIVCIETGEVFNCIKYALKKYHIKNEGSMSVALKHPERTAGKQHWAIYSDIFLNDEYRINYLKEVLLKNKYYKPMICLNDLKMYPSKIYLAEILNTTPQKINWSLKKESKFIYKDKTYILLQDY